MYSQNANKNKINKKCLLFSSNLQTKMKGNNLFVILFKSNLKLARNFQIEL